MNAVKNVMLVGHCGPDTWALKSWVERTLKGVPVETVHDQASLARINGDTLLLINRILDGRFDDHQGIELIRKLSARSTPPAMMLISNYPDALQEAQDAGALPGFGKSELGSPQATQRLLQAGQVVDVKT